MTPAGLPHSEIPGSQVVCTSPRLIAAYHVLLRFPEPRHPPYALILLDFYFRLPANTRLTPRSAQPEPIVFSTKLEKWHLSKINRKRPPPLRDFPETSRHIHSGPSNFASIQHHCLPETSAPPSGPPPGREAIPPNPAEQPLSSALQGPASTLP